MESVSFESVESTDLWSLRPPSSVESVFVVPVESESYSVCEIYGVLIISVGFATI